MLGGFDPLSPRFRQQVACAAIHRFDAAGVKACKCTGMTSHFGSNPVNRNF